MNKVELKILFFLFCSITTAIVLFVGVQATITDENITFTGIDLLKLVSVSFASTLPSLIFVGQRSTSRKKVIILSATHFILTAGAVFGLLILYEWIDAATAIYTVLCFLFVYVTAYTVIEIRGQRLAKRLNDKINAFHEAENETHDD